MFKRLFLISAIFIGCFAMEEEEDRSIRELGEPRSISAHYYPTDVWLGIAEHLSTEHPFLIIDIARNMMLDSKTRKRIIDRFLQVLEKKGYPNALIALENFFTKSNLDDDKNLLKKEFEWVQDFIKHYKNCSLALCADCEELIQNKPELNQLINEILKRFSREKRLVAEENQFSEIQKFGMYSIIGGTLLCLAPSLALSVATITSLVLSVPKMICLSLIALISCLSVNANSINIYDNYIKPIIYLEDFAASIKYFVDNICESKEMLFIGLGLAGVIAVYYYLYRIKFNKKREKYIKIDQLFS